MLHNFDTIIRTKKKQQNTKENNRRVIYNYF